MEMSRPQFCEIFYSLYNYSIHPPNSMSSQKHGQQPNTLCMMVQSAHLGDWGGGWPEKALFYHKSKMRQSKNSNRQNLEITK